MSDYKEKIEEFRELLYQAAKQGDKKMILAASEALDRLIVAYMNEDRDE